MEDSDKADSDDGSNNILSLDKPYSFPAKNQISSPSKFRMANRNLSSNR
jgi:hypothetical protein